MGHALAARLRHTGRTPLHLACVVVRRWRWNAALVAAACALAARVISWWRPPLRRSSGDVVTADFF
ncbi:hypothetical protein F511_45041 [Dorcoceras hygrometricum]|uniref:Uncharacterized protein n=1 Tax=Dorcoceras hygrometricum TaxID=472368 RepID=A0A2Z6ZX00_9LAMI|nr:hypothetical protein F511_45041 [Dorcoceras hygrometricum]